MVQTLHANTLRNTLLSPTQTDTVVIRHLLLAWKTLSSEGYLHARAGRSHLESVVFSFKDEPSRVMFFLDQGWVVSLGPEESPWVS